MDTNSKPHLTYHISDIIIDVPTGYSLGTMKRQACVAALEHGCDAHFLHNDKEYEVIHQDLIDRCTEEIKNGHG